MASQPLKWQDIDTPDTVRENNRKLRRRRAGAEYPIAQFIHDRRREGYAPDSNIMDFEVAVGPTKRKSIPRARESASEMPRSKRARTVSENPTFLDYDVAALLNNDDAFPPPQPSSTQDATPFARATTSSHPRVHDSSSLAKTTRAATPQSTWLVAAGLHCYPPGVHSAFSNQPLNIAFDMNSSPQAYWPAVQTHENVYPLMPASVVNPPPLSPPTFTVPTQLPSYQVAQWSGNASTFADAQLRRIQPHPEADTYSATTHKQTESFARRDRRHNPGVESPSSFNNGAQHQNDRLAAPGRIRFEESVAGHKMRRFSWCASLTDSSAVGNSTANSGSASAPVTRSYFEGRQRSMSSDEYSPRSLRSVSSGPSSATRTTPESARLAHAPFNPSLSFDAFPTPSNLRLVDRVDAPLPFVEETDVDPSLRHEHPAGISTRMMPTPTQAMPSTLQYERTVGDAKTSSGNLAWEWISRVLDNPEDECFERSEQDWYQSMNDAWGQVYLPHQSLRS
ncbi:hypothetical protein ACG7TL_008482 [Trametes sanguinea]